ncbi:MAG: UDP-glucose 4-epimerase GalE [Pseudomonadota bacterium]
MQKKILVTGASGYIGSHACVELLQSGFDVVGVDNLCNSSPKVIKRIEQIARRQLPFYEADIRDRAALHQILREQAIDAVIHFAGIKAVGESVTHPLRYFDNNVTGTVTLLQCLAEAGVKHIVFSSSATVYGEPEAVPIKESARLNVTNPYGRSKLMIEEILRDLQKSDPHWQMAILRYFNPVGAHPSGTIGEDPHGVPNNLMPFLSQVAIGRRPCLPIFGNDYPTPDGTGVRDYIHVLDLVQGHIAALERIFADVTSFAVNLGTGRGYSVLEIIRTFESVSGIPIPYEMMPRRAGDIASCFAAPEQAQKLLDWQAKKNLEEMCVDHWRWQTMNPQGY